MEFSVRFQPSGRSIRVPAQTSLLEAAALAGLPVARGCGARGMCGRCGMRIVDGSARVADASTREIETRRANRIDPDLRLACAVFPTGDLVVSAPYW